MGILADTHARLSLVPDFDAQELRRALGRFATGVAVITTRNARGRPVGLTINSFVSVSLDPPLVAWSLQRESRLASVFSECSHYAVNVLTTEQQALSERFASTLLNHFDEVSWSEGSAGCPLLDGCCAQIMVSSENRYPGGDHYLHLGRVIALASGSGDPLLFFGSRYRRLEAQE